MITHTCVQAATRVNGGRMPTAYICSYGFVTVILCSISILMISTILPILLAFGVWSIMTSSDGKSIDLEIDQRLRVFCPSIDNFYTNAFYNKGLL